MAIHFAGRHATCSASRPPGELATQFTNWLRSSQFNNVRLLNVYDIMCLHIGRIAEGLFRYLRRGSMLK